MLSFFIPWLFGYSLSKGIDFLIQLVKRDDLINNINKEIKIWIKTIPEELGLYEEALIPTDEYYGDLEKLSDIVKLKKAIHDKQIPTKNVWKKAFLQLWNFRKDTLGDNAQPFFKLDVKIVNGYLDTISSSLFNICKDDQSFFNRTVYDIIAGENINETTKIVDRYLIDLIDKGSFAEALSRINNIRKIDKINQLQSLNDILIINESNIFIKTHNRKEYQSQITALESINPSFKKYYYLLLMNKHFSKDLTINEFIEKYNITDYEKELKYYYSLKWENKDNFQEIDISGFDADALEILLLEKLVICINSNQNELGKTIIEDNSKYLETTQGKYAATIIKLNLITNGKNISNLTSDEVKQLNVLYNQFINYKIVLREANKDLLENYHYNCCITACYIENDNWQKHFEEFRGNEDLVLRFINFLIIVLLHNYIDKIILENPNYKKNKKIANQLIKYYYITNQNENVLEFKNNSFQYDNEFQIYIDLVESIQIAKKKKKSFSESDLINLKNNKDIAIFNITSASIFNFYKSEKFASKYYKKAKKLEDQFNEMEWSQYFALSMKMEDDSEVNRIYKKLSIENPLVIIAYINYLMRTNESLLYNINRINSLFSDANTIDLSDPDLLRLKAQYYKFVGEKDKAIKIYLDLTEKYDSDVDWLNGTIATIEYGDTEKLRDLEKVLKNKHKTSTIYLTLSLCSLHKDGLGIETRLELFSKYLFDFFMSAFPKELMLNDILIPPIYHHIVINGYHLKYEKKIIEANTYITVKNISNNNELFICIHSNRVYGIPIKNDYMGAKHIYFESEDALELQYKKVGDEFTILDDFYTITRIDSLWNYPGNYLNRMIMRSPEKFGVTPVEIKNDPVVDSFHLMYESEQRNKEIISKYNHDIYPVYLMTSGLYRKYIGLFLQLLTDNSNQFKAGNGANLYNHQKFVISYSSLILLYIFGKLETIDSKLLVISKSTLHELNVIKKELSINPEEEKLSIALDKDNIPIKFVSGSNENITKIQNWIKMIKYLSKAEIVDTVDIDDNLSPYVKAIGKLEIDSLRVAKEKDLPLIVDDNNVQQYSRLLKFKLESNLIPFYFNFSSDTLLEKLTFIDQLSQWQYRFIIYPGFVENCVEIILKESNIIIGGNTIFDKFISLLKRELRTIYPTNYQNLGYINSLKYLISKYLDPNSEFIFVELLEIVDENDRHKLENLLIKEYILHKEFVSFIKVCFKQVVKQKVLK